MQNNHKLRSVFFDLDGTLLDTAPDLISALTAVLVDEGFPAPSSAAVKPYISKGAAGMVRFAVGDGIDETTQGHLVSRLVEHYRAHIADNTRLYKGMETVLNELESRRLSWGIVTNKRASLTDPLIRKLNLHRRAVCVISGDSTKNRKPHPEPLFAACEKSGHVPPECVYIGDAERDIAAGRAAGMSTLAATYGYLDEDDEPKAWGACGLIAKPIDLLAWLENER